MRLAVPWAWVAVAWLVATPALALPGHTWLVVIGNNEGEPHELSLLYAERDARHVAEVFRTEGGVSTRRTLQLLGEDAPTIRRELLRVNTTIRAHKGSAHDVEANSTGLVVFYSGHADADALHLGGSTLAFDELRALVESSPASVRLLVVDACRSGSVTRVKGVKPTRTFAVDFDDKIATEGMAIITSSAAGESSQESDDLRAAFFTHHLINALRGAADRNGDGQVTLGETYAYTYGQTLRSSGRTLDLQHPTYEYDVKGRGELILAKPGALGRRRGRLRLGSAGIYLISEKREGGPVVAEVSPPQDRAMLALPVDTYFVQQRRPREYREYNVTLEPGKAVDLATQPYTAVNYDRLVRRRGGRRRFVHGLTLLTGVRGEIIEGEGARPQVVVGYGLDLPWLTLGVRFRGTTSTGHGPDGALPRRHGELGVGLSLQRFVDLRWLSASFGVLAEGVYHRQVFNADRTSPNRRSLGASFGGLFSVERSLLEGLSMRIEGGPVTTIFEQATTELGATTGQETVTPFTWWAAGGLVWRL